jgi:hypothetical protein
MQLSPIVDTLLATVGFVEDSESESLEVSMSFSAGILADGWNFIFEYLLIVIFGTVYCSSFGPA